MDGGLELTARSHHAISTPVYRHDDGASDRAPMIHPREPPTLAPTVLALVLRRLSNMHVRQAWCCKRETFQEASDKPQQ
jgi:hypothetical protein